MRILLSHRPVLLLSGSGSATFPDSQGCRKSPNKAAVTEEQKKAHKKDNQENPDCLFYKIIVMVRHRLIRQVLIQWISITY